MSETIEKGVPASAKEGSAFEEEVVRIYRCATVVKGGRRFSFSALVVMGDRQGQVGVGYGKAPEVPSAVEKAKKIAMRNVRRIGLKGRTLPHRVVGRYGAAEVVMLPASPGTGVIAGGSVRPVLELAGVQDVLTKSYGSRNAKNVVQATLRALCRLFDPAKVEELRGVTLSGRD